MQRVIYTSMNEEDLKELIQDSIRQEIQNQSKTSELKEDEETLLNSKEAAKLLRVSTVTLHKWKMEGRVPFIRIGSRIRFRKSEVLKALETVKKYHR